MNNHLERIKAEEASFLKGKRMRNRSVFGSILLCVVLAYAVGILAGPKKAESITPPEQANDPTLSYTQPQESYWNLLLINTEHPITEDLDIKLKQVEGFKVDSRIADRLLQMLRAADEEGISLTITAGYRTLAMQQTLREQNTEQLLSRGFSLSESEALTDADYALPGESDYHTGLAVCFATADESDFDGTAAGCWLLQHAAEYGFILRYPQGKVTLTGRAPQPGHYRFVGLETAAYMNELGFCLEEYRGMVFSETTSTRGQVTKNDGS